MSLQKYIMGNGNRALFVLFSLILIHVLMSSLPCLHHERKVLLLYRNQGRRLLVSVSSLLSKMLTSQMKPIKTLRKLWRQVSGRLHQVFQTLLRTSSLNSICVEISERKRNSFSFSIFAVFPTLDRYNNWISIQVLVFL